MISENTDAEKPFRRMVIIIAGAALLVYGLGARTMGIEQLDCGYSTSQCGTTRGLAWFPLVVVVIGSWMLASQCLNLRAFKNMYMFGIMVISFAALSALLGNLACGLNNQSSNFSGCTSATASGFIQVGLSGTVIISMATYFLMRRLESVRGASMEISRRSIQELLRDWRFVVRYGPLTIVALYFLFVLGSSLNGVLVFSSVTALGVNAVFGRRWGRELAEHEALAAELTTS